MKRRIRLEKSHFCRTAPGQPVIKSIKQWPKHNQGFYDRFRAWLRQGGYGESALNLYSVSARLALGLLDKPYWQIDPETDLAQVQDYLAACYPSDSTRRGYAKGLSKLAEFLRWPNPRSGRPKPSTGTTIRLPCRSGWWPTSRLTCGCAGATGPRRSSIGRSWIRSAT